MTTTLDAVNPKKNPEPTAEAAAAAELVRMAREKGWSLIGPDGLLKQLTKTVLETHPSSWQMPPVGTRRLPRTHDARPNAPTPATR